MKSVAPISLALVLVMAGCQALDKADPPVISTSFVRPSGNSLAQSRPSGLSPQFCTRLGQGEDCVATKAFPRNYVPADLPLSANVPNVRIRGLVDQIFHEPVAGGGLEGDFLARFLFLADPADEQLFNDQITSAAPAGQTNNFDAAFYPYGYAVVHDSLQLDACSSFSGIAIENNTEILELETEMTLAVFEATDETTIDATGIYPMSYVIEVSDDQGRISRFHISGQIVVQCTEAMSVF